MDVFGALAEPTRRSIIELLAARGQLPASAIYRRFHTTPQAVSQHLRVLRDARLVRVERQAQHRVYRINPAAIHEIEEWTRQLKGTWNSRLDKLELHLSSKEGTHGRK